MTLRIIEIHRVLKSTGSFYLHCDPTASHYLKLVLDSVFVTQGGDYKNEIVWKRTSAHNSAKRFGSTHDVIFYYTKSRVRTFNKAFTNHSKEQISRYRPDETGRLYKAENLTGAGVTSTRTVEWRGVHPGANRHWMWSIEEMERLLEAGLILLREDGKPRKDGYKVYLDESQGRSVGDVWDDIERIGNTAAERLGYPTQKPEALLERIIAASSNEGDVILDAYCGCGTTIAVAQRLKRQWIGIDITYQSIGVIMKRLIDAYGKEVGENVVLNGIPRDMPSARALANKKDDRVRKEFEKWAVLTFSRHQAIINAKKGADGGVDGIQYFPASFGSDEMGKVLYQVKSGGVKRGDIAQMRGEMAREGAQLGVFLTLEEPSSPMKVEAASAGTYELALMKKNLPVITIATIQDMVENNARFELPISHLANKKAAASAVQTNQIALDLGDS